MIPLRGPGIPTLAIVLAVLLLCGDGRSIRAADDDPGPPEILNCGDPSWRDLCMECDGPPVEGPKLACCEYDSEGKPTCTIVNEPPEPPTTGFTAADIVIKITDSGLKLEFRRKEVVSGSQLLVKFKLKGQLLTPAVRKRIGVKGTFSGLDASVGSLAYAVVFLGRGEAALGALQSQGKDLTLEMSGLPVTCQSSFTATECNLLAVQMSKLIDGALPPGGDERTGFLGSVVPLGYSACSRSS